ncbi:MULTISPECIES: acylphosphatase [Paraliobacillus]|uniref:acylphosphatase n=1 Tax=Paraliobacillus TaxID=200903 RepID=UPI000DD37639|nr:MULTISPECIES: acylphosphatase [Paraliobacillus]
MSKLGAHMLVSGVVQGVGFRATTQMKATEMGVNGWVKNLADGRVEIEAEAEVETLYEFIDLIKKGPRKFIKVDHVELTTYEKLNDFQNFKVV